MALRLAFSPTFTVISAAPVIAALFLSHGFAHRPGEMMAKVYRQCYALNPVFIRLNNSGEAVPSSLSTVTIKDVTAEYVSTQDVRIRIDPALKKRNKYAYVAVFDNRNWVPVGFGDVG